MRSKKEWKKKKRLRRKGRNASVSDVKQMIERRKRKRKKVLEKQLRSFEWTLPSNDMTRAFLPSLWLVSH